MAWVTVLFLLFTVHELFWVISKETPLSGMRHCMGYSTFSPTVTKLFWVISKETSVKGLSISWVTVLFLLFIV